MNRVKELIRLIRIHTEAGTILEHMELFDKLEDIVINMQFLGTYGGKDIVTVIEDKKVKRGNIHITVDGEAVCFEGIIK